MFGSCSQECCPTVLTCWRITQHSYVYSYLIRFIFMTPTNFISCPNSFGRITYSISSGEFIWMHLLFNFFQANSFECITYSISSKWNSQFKHFSLRSLNLHTFCNPPGVLSPSDPLAVHLDDGVASYHSQRQLVLVKEQHLTQLT